MPIQLGAISQIAVNVKDLERARSFYRGRLGLKELFAVPGMAFFECAGQRLMLSLPSAPEFNHPSSILYFRSEDIDTDVAQLGDAGVEFRAMPQLAHRGSGYELWLAFFEDGEGNTHALMEERSATGE